MSSTTGLTLVLLDDMGHKHTQSLFFLTFPLYIFKTLVPIITATFPWTLKSAMFDFCRSECECQPGVNCFWQSQELIQTSSRRLDHAHRLRPPSLHRDFQMNRRRILLSHETFLLSLHVPWRRQGHWLMRAIKISANQLGEQFVHLGAVIAVLLWSFHNQTLLNIIVTSYIRCGNYQSPIQFCQFPKPVLSAGWDRGRLSGSTVVHDKRRWKLHRESANCSNLTPSIYQGEFVKNHVESTSIFLKRNQSGDKLRRSDEGCADLTADNSDMKHTQFMQYSRPVWTQKHWKLPNTLMMWCIYSSAPSRVNRLSPWHVILQVLTTSNLSTLLLTVHCENCPLTQSNNHCKFCMWV